MSDQGGMPYVWSTRQETMISLFVACTKTYNHIITSMHEQYVSIYMIIFYNYIIL